MTCRTKPATGFWSRVGHAFSGLVQIRAMTASRRRAAHWRAQLTALDLAQAQAALLAWDPDGVPHRRWRAPTSAWQHDFDAEAKAVQRRARADQRAARKPVPPAPQLGAALHELEQPACGA